MAEWLAEKSCGGIQAEDVKRITLDQLDAALLTPDGKIALESWLGLLEANQMVIIDAEHHEQLAIFGEVVRHLIGKKRFLF